MFCKRGIYINWGNIPHLELDFGPINLFSGGNGSGKTTAADGLQSLMTAAHENLFNFNPGQDETTQKGRGGKQVRTLASYILGCDDGSYARMRTTDGYVAAIFHPTEGETAEVFTAIMGVRARLDTSSSPRQARQDALLFLILPGIELSMQDLVCEDKGGKYVVPLNELANRLKGKYGQPCVETYDKKGPYLRRLYGALRGLKGAVPDREAKHAARTFSNFMAYKPVKSISEFVAREVLEPKDLSEDIRQVSELMKTIHAMDEETQQLNTAIQNLEKAHGTAQSYIGHWLDHRIGLYSEASRQLLGKQQEYVNYKTNQNDITKNIADTQRNIQQHQDKKRVLHDGLIELHAKRQGIDALKNKDQLETDISDYIVKLRDCVGPLLAQDKQFSRNFQAASQLHSILNENSMGVDIPELDDKTTRGHLKSVIAAGDDTGLDMQQLLTKDWTGLEGLEHTLEQVEQLEKLHIKLWQRLHHSDAVNNEHSLRDQVFAGVEKQRDKMQRAKLQAAVKQQEIQQLNNKKVAYPEHVEQALMAIQQHCPQAKACVLCDFVEVTDPEWQMAIEGYMGGARFGILVEPDYEADAIRIVRSMSGRRNNARVIQGAKAQRDAKHYQCPHNSILDVMTFEHKIAEYYLSVSYGAVLRVDNAEALKKTARGITSEGLGSGNYSLFRCDMDDAQLVFGQGARERALSAKQSQWQELQQQYQQTEAQLQAYTRVHALCTDINEVACGDSIRQMLNTQHQLHSAETQLANLDLRDFDEIEGRLNQLKDEYEQVEKNSAQLSESLGALHTQAKLVTRNIDRVSDEQEDLQKNQERYQQVLVDLPAVYPDFITEDALEAGELRAQKAGAGISFEQDNIELLEQAEKCERELYTQVIQHNQISNTYNNIVYFMGTGERHELDFFKHMVALDDNVQSLYHALKNNVLVGKHEKLTSLKESFNTAFVTNLCHSIYQAINTGERILKELNTELEHHRFGADRERFYFDYRWVPEFKEYRDFFKEVINIPNLGDGSTLFEADLSDKSCKIRDRLLSMLLDKDEFLAQRELKRISDYRNFRHYEIYKQPENKEPIALSTYGTGSGGQLETPAYIIRAAAVTSAFRFNEGNSHCRMVLVDEAFSKMDETRSREVINYLTKSLGLQLIFIMPTSKSGPFMDLISHQTVFSKCPTTEKIGELSSRVLVDRKVCNQEKIKTLWANHRKTIRKQSMLDFMEGV
ncbi:MAG: hypothetical protein COA42_11040 [Alteromonadaceae bacterium]|nr:MAG: hypothetical protein COA42_11040 [Alteromonadaceae bacterium]